MDQMSHNHHGGSYYMAPDGACHWYNEPYVNPTTYAANDWHARAPSGSLVSLGLGLKWGQWEAK